MKFEKKKIMLVHFRIHFNSIGQLPSACNFQYLFYRDEILNFPEEIPHHLKVRDQNLNTLLISMLYHIVVCF